MTQSLVGAAAAPLSIHATAIVASAVLRAARQLLTDLERGCRIDAGVLRNAMQAAFGASDATSAWNWKTAYDTCEAATALFVRRCGAAMRAKATSPAAMLPMLMRSLLPTHTRQSEESESPQQFSTPIGLAFVASPAAAITPADIVLEPSAGTGLLAILAELAGASLVLRESAESCAGVLSQPFPAVSTTRFGAAHINDHLDAGILPSVVLMNPPFSAAVHIDRQMREAALRHLGSELARLPEGGQLVTMTGANVAPDHPAWTDSFMRLREQGRVQFSAAIDSAVHAGHGTNIETRLIVIDRVPADDIASFPASPSIAQDLPTLLGWVIQYVPPRRPIVATAVAAVPAIANPPAPRTVRTYFGQRQPSAVAPADTENAVRFRRGWFLGGGTGASKGRQVAGIVLDNWVTVWISKSDKLIEDAQRDWSALGMERLLVTPPLSRFRQGMPVRFAEGVLFTTYATLRSDECGEKLSRVRQVVEWLDSDFDRVIAFDESHAMQNAAERFAPAWLGELAPKLAPDTAFAGLMEGRTVLDLAEGLQLRRVRVMGAYGIELSGFDETMRDRVGACGLFGEIISWKLRLFVPADASGAEILAKVLDRYAIERIVEREAA
jgi:predicted RNA methylase